MKKSVNKGRLLLLALLLMALSPAFAEASLKEQYLQIDMFVGAPGEADYDFNEPQKAKHRPAAAGEAFGFSIVSYLPEGIGRTLGERYTITDQLTDDFIYLPGTVKVYLLKAKNTPCSSGYRLTENEQYQISYNGDTNTLEAHLTDEGLALIKQRNETETVRDDFVLIKFDSILSEDAAQGINLYNGARTVYAVPVNPLSRAVQEQSITAEVTDKPEVHTGQILLLKVAADSEELLANAEFGIAATRDEVDSNRFIGTGKTNEKGELVFSGLTYGVPGDDSSQNSIGNTYWLKELKAPQGYGLLTKPIEIKFQRQANADTGEIYFARVKVVNAREKQQQTPTESVPKPPQKSLQITGTASGAKTGDNTPVIILMVAATASLIVMAAVLKKRSRRGNNE